MNKDVREFLEYEFPERMRDSPELMESIMWGSLRI
jgi:hypothetical protein